MLKVYETELRSRLLLGTSRYPSPAVLTEAADVPLAKRHKRLPNEDPLPQNRPSNSRIFSPFRVSDDCLKHKVQYTY